MHNRADFADYTEIFALGAFEHGVVVAVVGKEQEQGIGAFFMGLSFITEGALPFVFSDFVRVIPACMLGSAVSGVLSMLFGCTLPAPHGGIFVLPVMGHPILYLIALAIGSLVTAVVLGRWKKPVEDLGVQNF